MSAYMAMGDIVLILVVLGAVAYQYRQHGDGGHGAEHHHGAECKGYHQVCAF